MAYSRFRRSGNYRRRVRRGVRRYRRRFRRGARRYMRRSMSRRKVADISSSKMRDNMAATPIADGGAEGEIGDPAIITSEASAAILFCPSARGAQWSEGESEYSRQKTEVYAKGYLENVTIETIGPGNWRWRRIVFQCHSQDIISTYPQNTMANYDNANGYKRATPESATVVRILLGTKLFYVSCFRVPLDTIMVTCTSPLWIGTGIVF
jgi:hypothetical protein